MPLNCDFDSSGVVASLVRVYTHVALEYDTPDLPSWILKHCSVSLSELGADEHAVVSLISDLHTLERKIRHDTTYTRVVVDDSCEEGRSHQCEQDDSRVFLVVNARIMLGACCEAYCVLQGSRLFPPETDIPIRDGKHEKEMQQLYHDSCKVSVWTSAHTQYAADALQMQVSLVNPTIYAVPSELTEIDMSSLYARRVHTKSLSSHEAEDMLSIVTKCTNPGMRGWDMNIKKMLQRSEGVRRVCMNAMVVSITAMNSFVHPAHRLHWKKRHVLLSVIATQIRPNSFTETASRCGPAFKECVRRMTCNSISSSYAMVSALARLKHPIALLRNTPMHLPLPGLESSSTALAIAGRRILQVKDGQHVVDCIHDAFNSDTYILKYLGVCLCASAAFTANSPNSLSHVVHRQRNGHCQIEDKRN